VDQATAIDTVKKYSRIVRQHFPVKAVILFGSYAKGTARIDSDIDVAVIVDRIGDDYLDSAAKLCYLRNDLEDRIEPVLLEAGNDPGGFLEEIWKTGKVIYNAEELI